MEKTRIISPFSQHTLRAFKRIAACGHTDCVVSVRPGIVLYRQGGDVDPWWFAARAHDTCQPQCATVVARVVAEAQQRAVRG